jgi:SAM-dependent methyltransferase
MKKAQIIKLNPSELNKLLGIKSSDYLSKKLKEYNLEYSRITSEEKDFYLRKVIGTLVTPFIVYSGPHRFKDWNKGWGNNLRNFKKTGSIDSINPGYFNKYPIFRIDQEWVKAKSDNFEKKSLAIILDFIADKYFRNLNSIYEFGCGTGHHLLQIREVNQNAEIWGLDWVPSSQSLIKKLAKKLGDDKLFAYQFDFFKPDQNFRLKPKSGVYTVAALEQVGDNYKKYIDYLLKNKPAIVAHIEPIAELLNTDRLLDFLSVEYFKKRKYLSGFLTYLQMLEKKGKIKILRARRSNIGSLYIEGYSTIVWKPI